MPRLREVSTGAIVSVPDEKVERMGTTWVPADATEDEKPKRATRKTAAKK